MLPIELSRRTPPYVHAIPLRRTIVACRLPPIEAVFFVGEDTRSLRFFVHHNGIMSRCIIKQNKITGSARTRRNRATFVRNHLVTHGGNTVNTVKFGVRTVEIFEEKNQFCDRLSQLNTVTVKH